MRREIERKLLARAPAAKTGKLCALKTFLERSERIPTRHPKNKNKLYAQHGPEVDWIGKDSARETYERGVKPTMTASQKR